MLEQGLAVGYMFTAKFQQQVRDDTEKWHGIITSLDIKMNWGSAATAAVPDAASRWPRPAGGGHGRRPASRGLKQQRFPAIPGRDAAVARPRPPPWPGHRICAGARLRQIGGRRSSTPASSGVKGPPCSTRGIARTPATAWTSSPDPRRTGSAWPARVQARRRAPLLTHQAQQGARPDVLVAFVLQRAFRPSSGWPAIVQQAGNDRRRRLAGLFGQRRALQGVFGLGNGLAAVAGAFAKPTNRLSRHARSSIASGHDGCGQNEGFA